MMCVTGDTQGTQVVYNIIDAIVMTVRMLCDRRHSGDTGGIQYN